jgi:hypothetical protein
MIELLKQLDSELQWSRLKHQDIRVAKLMEKLAPVFVSASLKLSRTRAIQAQSRAKRKE